MCKLVKIFLTYLLATFSFGLIAQNKVDIIKSERLQSGYEPWNFCFVDGLPKTQSITDSINGFSISVPNGHNLTIGKTDGFRTLKFMPIKSTSESNILMEVWVRPKDNIKLENLFNQAIDYNSKNKIPFRIGTEIINQKPSYWMETYNAEMDKLWELTFYFKQPNTESTILIKQKSFKKKKYRQDFCIYGYLIRNLRWL